MFQQIISTLGQMDGQYQHKTEVVATLIDVKAVEFSQTSGKPKQGLHVRADNGEDAWINLIGKGAAEDPRDVGDRGRYVFLVWPFKADQSPKTSLYCWIQRASTGNAPQPQAASPQTPVPGSFPAFNIPQSPQSPAQAPMPAQGTIDPTRNSIEAQTALKAAVDLAIGRKDLVSDVPAIFDLQSHFKTLLQTGKVNFTVTHAPVDTTDFDPNQDDSDLPEEMRKAR